MTNYVTDIDVGKMTEEEAIELLAELQCETIKQVSTETDVKNFKAINIAIEALKEIRQDYIDDRTYYEALTLAIELMEVE